MKSKTEKDTKKKTVRQGIKQENERLKKCLDEERSRSTNYLERLKYLQADFENHIKRIQIETNEEIKRGNERLILSIIPIIDDLEKAIELGKEDNDTPLQEGVRLVLQNLKQTLKGEGLLEIKTINEIFHPSWHEAVSRMIDMSKPEGLIVRELRKGYILNDRVIRPSLVEVVGHSE